MPTADRPVVTNTTPVVALAVLDRLHLFRDLCGEVLMPTAVREELAAGGDRPGSLIDLGRAPWIRTVALKVPQSAEFFSDLDRGESEVIALALEVDARMVVLDERLARRHAARLGLQLTGTVGLLIEATRRGLVARLEPLLDQLQANGFRVSPELRAASLRMAGEE
jgi:predicted nucleic acid-binding protein